MRVCLLSFGEPLPIDGPNIRLRRMGIIAHYAAISGWEVLWIAPAFNHITKQMRDYRRSPYMLDDKFTLHLFKSKKYRKNLSLNRFLSLFSDDSSFLKILKRERDNIDVLFFPLEYAPYLKRTLSFCKKSGIKIVMDLRDMWDMVFDTIPKNLYPLARLYGRFCERSLAKYVPFADGTISLSEPMQGWLLKYLGRGVNPSKDRIVPLCFPKNQVMKTAEDISTCSGISDHDFLIIYAGGLGKFVCVDEIIELSEKFSTEGGNIKFVVCGTGEKYHFLKEHESKSLMVLGQVGTDRLYSLYSIASLSIMPYSTRAFAYHAPNKYAEYLAYGLPILIRPRGFMMEETQHYECGVGYENGEELESIIRSFYTSRERLLEYSRNAKSLFSLKYQSEKEYLKLIEFIEGIATSS